MTDKMAIYQAKDGSIRLKVDTKKDTIWATQKQMAEVFDVNVRTINDHVGNILADNELDNSVIRKYRITASDGKDYETLHYNLDMIISVGYRVNSKQATDFRKWSTGVLGRYLLDGFVVDKKTIAQNYDKFIQTVEQVKLLASEKIPAGDALELIKSFADTWLSLDAYDKSELPESGASKKQVKVTGTELSEAIVSLKMDLIKKGEATELFASERMPQAIDGIVGNVFQSFAGADVYATNEEKAAHLLYFVVKNHPFTDGNKRSGAFSFVWFLQKAALLDKSRMSPEALTVLTLLVAESEPKKKDQIIGLILMLLKGKF